MLLAMGISVDAARSLMQHLKRTNVQQEETRNWAHLEDELKASRISFFEETAVFNIIDAWPMAGTQRRMSQFSQ